MSNESKNNETKSDIISKWKLYLDHHIKWHELEKTIEKYEKSMLNHQLIIYNWAKTHNEDLIEAVTNLCKQKGGAYTELQFICAGYELACGIDYTIDYLKNCPQRK